MVKFFDAIESHAKNISFTDQKILDGKEMSEIIYDTRFETEFVSAEDLSHMP